MGLTAVVPLKALARAKQRLAETLDPVARRELVVFMARRVVASCLRAASVERVLVVAGDERAAAAVRRHGVDVLVERRRGLDTALERAEAELAGTGPVLVLHADLPLVRPDDIDAVWAAGRRSPCVVVVPTRDGGTAALLRNPVGVIPRAFGPASGAEHLRLAREAHVAAIRLVVPRLAVDVDDRADLLAALAHDPALGRWTPPSTGCGRQRATTLQGDTHVCD